MVALLTHSVLIRGQNKNYLMFNIQNARCISLGFLLTISVFLFSQCSNQSVHQLPTEQPVPQITVRFAIAPKLEPESQPEFPQKQLSDEEIIQCYWRWYDLLGIKLPPGRNKHQVKGFPIEYNENHQAFIRQVDSVEGGGKFVNMYLDAVTGALYELFNDAVWTELYKLPFGTQPTKTKEEILEEASKYQRLIIGDLANNFRISLKRSQWMSRGGGTDLKGYWRVFWSRVFNGYEFLNDSPCMSFHEKYGVVSFVLHMRSLPCPTEVKIAEDQAKKIALATVPLVIPKLCHLPQKFKIKTITECDLYIINPHYNFSPGVISVWTYIDNRHTRLAYRIAFWIEGEAKNQDFKIVIEVDAATGEILGGDYPK